MLRRDSERQVHTNGNRCMAKPLIDPETFSTGLTFDAFLQAGAAAQKLQQRRFDEEPDEFTLKYFHTLRDEKPPRAILLASLRCNDCAWAVPYICRVLEEGGIRYGIFLKADHPELMDGMTTRGKRSTPKLALVDGEGYSISQWGPRPAEIQRYVEQRAGRSDPSEWRPAVFEYYRERGVPELRRELRETFERATSLRDA
ncbi:hypothetical protein GF324_09380 [bacterium]|nr:hypothetical protein [bacterium]